MSDQMCGPSNAAKGLAAHLEQDRSLQQDRTVQNGQPGQSFRSNNHGSVSAGNAQFEAFQNGASFGIVPNEAQHRLAPGVVPGPFSPSQVTGYPPTFHQGITPAIGQAHPTHGKNWVGQFNNMSIDNGQEFVQPVAPRPHMVVPLNSIPQSHYSQMNMSQSHFIGGTMQPMYGAQMNQPSMFGDVYKEAPPPYHEAVASPPTQSTHDNLDTLFDQAVNEIEAEEQPSQAELSRMADDADFQIEMDNWFAEQRAQERFNQLVRDAESEDGLGHWADQQDSDSDDELASEQDDELTPEQNDELAPEQNDTVSQTGDDLAQAAQQLVSIVENDQSEKFQNSSFLEVMRKIASSQLVVRDNQLVEADAPSPAADIGQAGPSTSSTDRGSPSHVTGRSQGSSNKNEDDTTA